MRKPEVALHTNEKYCLYSFFSSTCCQRIIIASHLKSIPLTCYYVDLRDDTLAKHFKEDPSLSANIPTLIVTHEDGTTTVVRQAINILEYFEERFPDSYPLLPSQTNGRTLTREFANIINIDVEPALSCRVAKRASVIGGGFGFEGQEIFATGAFRDGFAAYQARLESTRGAEAKTCLYTVGDHVTLADVCLVPAVEQAVAYGIDMSNLPHVMRIYRHLKKQPEFVANSNWRKHMASNRRL